MMFSIDQNCHSLWDVPPKLQALGCGGHERPVRHFIEDVDVAFTSIGAKDAPMHLARERYYRGGGADWGAAMFYSEFLGRLPVELRDWEPFTGMKTKALARELGLSVDDLYDQMSPGDNWQLIGPSYVGDKRHHRLIGDLSVAETAPFLQELMDLAQRDMNAAFPGAESRRRLDEWFSAERDHLADMLTTLAGGSLVELYRCWMGRLLPNGAELDLSSNLFACGKNAAQTAMMELFVRDYDHLAGLYNEAIDETSSAFRPLKTTDGELPFFATLKLDGHLVRTGVFLEADRKTLRIGNITVPTSDGGLPVDALKRAGILCLAGKAMLLVIQVRLGPDGAPLALPYRGSLYIPAAVRLTEKLEAENLLPGKLHPIIRVRLRLLDRMAGLDTPIHLPAHLAGAFGAAEITADHLAANWRDVRDSARSRLKAFRGDRGRRQWQRDTHGDLLDEIAMLDARRRSLAQSSPPPATEIRGVWKAIKSLKGRLLEQMVAQIACDWQTAELDYWDSRGAILPWSLALGGRAFYNKVVKQAEIYPE